MNEEKARFIDHLREAATKYGAVSDLLDLLESCLLIDGNGNREINGDDDDIDYLKAAQLAAVFARLDRKQG